jgi:NitT/TauT family transport system substrate-binding protein
MHMHADLARRAFLRGALIGGASAALAACSTGKTATATGSRKPLRKWTYLTGFGLAPREIGYPYPGLGQGFFVDAGIDLTIAKGNPSTANLEVLAAGKADFAAIDFVSAMLFASDPKYKSTVIMAVQHPTLLSVLSLPGRGITIPQDLVGKKIGTAGDKAATRTLFPAYAKLAGIDPGKVQFITASADDLPKLLATHQIDAMGGYQIDVPVVEKTAQGVLPIVLPYSNYLTNLYGTVIVCRKDLIVSEPELVKGFTSAMWKSITSAVTNPSAAGTYAKKFVPTADEGEVTDTMLLMHPSATSPVLEPDRVMQGIVLAESQNLLPQGAVKPDDVVTFGFAPTGA